jgi:hypothetical protein
MASSTRVTIALTPVLLKRIDEAANGLGLSRSAFMVGAVEEYLNQSEAALKAFANPNVREAYFRALNAPGVVQGLAKAIGEEFTAKDKAQLDELIGRVQGKREGRR